MKDISFIIHQITQRIMISKIVSVVVVEFSVLFKKAIQFQTKKLLLNLRRLFSSIFLRNIFTFLYNHWTYFVSTRELIFSRQLNLTWFENSNFRKHVIPVNIRANNFSRIIDGVNIASSELEFKLELAWSNSLKIKIYRPWTSRVLSKVKKSDASILNSTASLLKRWTNLAIALYQSDTLPTVWENIESRCVMLKFTLTIFSSPSTL